MRRAVILAGLFVLSACGRASDAGPAWDGVVRDSAGIRVVANGGTALWRAAQTWRAEPSLSIGSADGEETYLFGRVVDVAVDSRGRVLVLDAFSRDVRIFDGNGAFESRAGGPGDGPGELSQFANAVLIGGADTIFVPDYAQQRINVYEPGGSYVRMIPIVPRPTGQSWRRLEDGRFLFRGLTIGRDEAGNFRTSDGLFAVSGTGSPIDTIARFDYPASPLGAPGRPVAPLIVNSAIWARLPDGRIAWTSLDRDAIIVLGDDGVPSAIIRNASWTREPLTDEGRLELKELLRRKLTLLGGDAAGVDNLELVYEPTLPSITALMAGPNGTLWIQRMGRVESIDPMAVNASDAIGWLGGNVWSILDGEFRYLGDVVLPDRVRITRITADAIYGVSKDENDVEHVVRLDLVMPA